MCGREQQKEEESKKFSHREIETGKEGDMRNRAKRKESSINRMKKERSRAIYAE